MIGNGAPSAGLQNTLLLNDGSGVFTDAPAGAYPTIADPTRAAILVDLDGDSDLDVLVTNGSTSEKQNRLLRNAGDGTFTEITATHLPTDADATLAAAVGDVDGDGDVDALMGNGEQRQEQNRLYLNDGAGAFTDVTTASLPPEPSGATDLELADLDGDGDLDAFVVNWVYGRILDNDGTGIFTDVSTGRLPSERDRTDGVALGDVDGDGDVDALLGNGALGAFFYPQNRLYLNDGSGTFTDATRTHLPTDSQLTASVALGDLDGDGDLDAMYGNAGFNALLENDGTGVFSPFAAGRFPAVENATNVVTFGDVDGDGDLDILVGNRKIGFPVLAPQNLLYLNDGTGTFTDVTATHMPVDDQDTSALVLGDVDGDGDLDLMVGNAAPHVLSDGPAEPPLPQRRQRRLHRRDRHPPPRR